MHITILAIGSRGDIQPYTALALGLKAAGYQVRIATHRPYEDQIRTHGLEYAPVAGNPQELVRTEQSKLWLESGRNPFLFIRRLVPIGRVLFEDLLRDSWDVCQGTDVIIFSTLGVAGYHIAERLGLPSIYSPLQPFTRTQYTMVTAVAHHGEAVVHRLVAAALQLEVQVVVDEGGLAGGEGAEDGDQRPPGDLHGKRLSRFQQTHLVGDPVQLAKALYGLQQDRVLLLQVFFQVFQSGFGDFGGWAHV